MCKIMEELIAESREEGRVEMAIFSVKSLMKSLGTTSTNAMELLNIPEELKAQVIESIDSQYNSVYHTAVNNVYL